MKILITGGAGYLGSVLTERLLSIGHEVTVLDKLIFNQISLLPQVTNPKFNFVYGDVRNVKLLEKLCDENEVIIRPRTSCHIRCLQRTGQAVV